MKKIIWGLMVGFVFSTAIIASPARASSGYVGIGVTIQLNQVFSITNVLANGPGARAGILVGDTLAKIDGHPTQGLTLDNVITLMRGNVGTQVVLTLVSQGASTSHDIAAVREYIEIPCFMEGMLNLHLSGDDRVGTLSGWIGNDYVNWGVNYGRISAVFKTENVSLQVAQTTPGAFTISGYVHNQSVTWASSGGNWNSYQSCIPD